jgi:UDP-N-acetylbacillosamine transaminase
MTFSKTPYARIMQALGEVNVESRPLWKPMHLQPLFKVASSFVDGTSERLFDKGFCVASSTSMSKDDVRMVCETIKKNLVG